MQAPLCTPLGAGLGEPRCPASVPLDPFSPSAVDEEFETVSTQLLKRTQAMLNKYRLLLLEESRVGRWHLPPWETPRPLPLPALGQGRGGRGRRRGGWEGGPERLAHLQRDSLESVPILPGCPRALPRSWPFLGPSSLLPSSSPLRG